jgi:hypothetical protein
MSWFSARVIFECEVEGSDSRLWEERVFVIEADTDSDARKLLNKVLKKQRISYQNMYGQTVTWKRRGRAAIQDLLLDKITSGSEVFSRFLLERDIQCLERSKNKS